MTAVLAETSASLPRACGPYRARTKGKTESGVKYAKRSSASARS